MGGFPTKQDRRNAGFRGGMNLETALNVISAQSQRIAEMQSVIARQQRLVMIVTAAAKAAPGQRLVVRMGREQAEERGAIRAHEEEERHVLRVDGIESGSAASGAKIVTLAYVTPEELASEKAARAEAEKAKAAERPALRLVEKP
jgi:hypothetical protein